jgi:glycerol-3-phosphate dehydrogenase
MRFTRRSARRLRLKEHKRDLVLILGGKLSNSRSSAEVPMKHAKPAAATVPPPNVTTATQAREAYRRRRARRDNPCPIN